MAGIGGSGISFGPITGFGSVYQNDVRFDTGSAVVVVEGVVQGAGDQVVLNNLALGQVVRVEGTINADGLTGTAERIVFNDSVEGPISTISNDGGITILEVMGQSVLLDEWTYLDNTTLAEIRPGNVVEISGLVDQAGAIRATYLRKKANVLMPGTEVEVRGLVSDPDAGAATFMINNLVVDYSSADLSELAGEPGNGQLVEVKGVLNNSNVLVALEVEPDDDLGSENADQVEIKGYVTQMSSPTTFNLGNEAVLVTGTTNYENGSQADIAPGTRLEVEGILANGTVEAINISFADNIELESNVASVNPGAGTFTLTNLPGVQVVANSLTEISGGIGSFGELQPGYHAKVRGRTSVSGSVIAMELDAADSSDPKVTLQGPLDSALDPIIVILNVSVDTTGVPDGAFSGVDSAPTKRAGFFTTVKPGDIVRVSGEVDPVGGVLWQEIVLEDID